MTFCIFSASRGSLLIVLVLFISAASTENEDEEDIVFDCADPKALLNCGHATQPAGDLHHMEARCNAMEWSINCWEEYSYQCATGETKKSLDKTIDIIRSSKQEKCWF